MYLAAKDSPTGFLLKKIGWIYFFLLKISS
jgi:hypothetical protein